MKLRKPTKREVIKGSIIAWAVAITVAVAGQGYLLHQNSRFQDQAANQIMSNSFGIMMIVQFIRENLSNPSENP